jgi:hypothetical protein
VEGIPSNERELSYHLSQSFPAVHRSVVSFRSSIQQLSEVLFSRLSEARQQEGFAKNFS